MQTFILPRKPGRARRRDELELPIGLGNLDQEGTGGGPDESRTDGPNAGSLDGHGGVGRSAGRSGCTGGHRSGSHRVTSSGGADAGRGDDGALRLGSAGRGDRRGGDDEGGRVDRGGSGDRDGGLTVLDGEKVGGADFTETFRVEVGAQRSGAESESGRGGKIGLLVDEEEDVTVGTGSLERSRSDVVDAKVRGRRIDTNVSLDVSLSM